MSELTLNFMDLHEIDITPNAVQPTWARIAEGIEDADPSNNDNVDQTPYLSGEGHGTSTVIGMQKTISFTGHRYVGDAAQDYIASIQNHLSKGRETKYRYTDADGTKLTAPCTIANIDIGGGGADAKKDLSFEVHLNGKPAETPRAPAEELGTTVTAGSTEGTTTFTASPEGDNTLAYRLLPQSAGVIYGGQYIEGTIAYTAEDEIVASEGQYLQMFELDANKRVAKFNEHELVALDIG